MSPQELATPPLAHLLGNRSANWRVSWPLLAGLGAFFYALAVGSGMLVDGDTYWHVAAGLWMFQNGTVPTVDPFSHTMAGSVWTAHEWLAEILLAGAHEIGGWGLVGILTAAAFAATFALLLRSLLRWVEPVYAILFTVLALAMTFEHLLARPHILAMPLMMVWTIELVLASEGRRTPRWWMLPVMIVWANLHGGFTFGLVLACAFTLEAVVEAEPERRLSTAKSWALFLALAVGSSMVTPLGFHGLFFTWTVLFELGFMLSRIAEWRSPNFHEFNALELWLLAGMGLVLYQGLRLPPIRLLLVLGVLHMALKHVRYIELVGLLTPLFVAGPFAAQWRQAREGRQQLAAFDRLFDALTPPAGRSATLAALVLTAGVTVWAMHTRPMEPTPNMPVRAVAEVQKAKITGPVLNGYGGGGYLIYMGIPVYIDGRADLYGDAFMKEFADAADLRVAGEFERLLSKYRITWTLLPPGAAANQLLAHLPGWQRFYSDEVSVVYVKTSQVTQPAPIARMSPVIQSPVKGSAR